MDKNTKEAVEFWEDFCKDDMSWEDFCEKYYRCDRCGSFEKYEDLGCICYAR